MDASTVDASAASGGSRAIWILDFAPYVGLALLILMIIVVAWRVITKQPTATAEVLVGVIGILVLLVPVIDNFSFEGLGLKSSVALRNVSVTNEALAARVAVLEATVRADPAGTIPSGDASTAGAVRADVQDVVTLVYFGQGRRQEAEAIRDALLAKGYPASIIATDFSELGSNPPPSGTVRLVFARSAEALVPDIGNAVSSVVSADRVTQVGPADIRNGQVQVQLL